MSLLNEITTKLSNFGTSARMYAVDRTVPTVRIDSYIELQELITYLQSILEEIIYEPATEPAIVTGSPNTLTIDLNNARQGNFEPRLSVATRTINTDFDLVLANASNGRYIDLVFSFSGTRIIELPANVVVSIPSTIGEFVAPNLTITTSATSEIIMILKYLKSADKWDLSVNEITP